MPLDASVGHEKDRSEAHISYAQASAGWSLDFVADQLADGRRFRALTVLDVFTRESLAIEVGQRLKGEDVVSALNQIRGTRGVPKVLFCDNGSEFTSQIMDLLAYHNRVQIDFSRPGNRPTMRMWNRSTAPCARSVWMCTGSRR